MLVCPSQNILDTARAFSAKPAHEVASLFPLHSYGRGDCVLKFEVHFPMARRCPEAVNVPRAATAAWADADEPGELFKLPLKPSRNGAAELLDQVSAVWPIHFRRDQIHDVGDVRIAAISHRPVFLVRPGQHCLCDCASRHWSLHSKRVQLQPDLLLKPFALHAVPLP